VVFGSVPEMVESQGYHPFCRYYLSQVIQIRLSCLLQMLSRWI
jgi:hypothetical protein